ncbi:MAG: AraC family transcriptional regulator [Clostridia bacterium]|nr:AraC family transcriptional regulator [Clostridia bacterium]MCX7843510.1 AraC family transcriptional regulator [Clostridia bacterium]
MSRQVGYNDVSYFCAVFRDNEGLTPSEFRKMYKK